MTDGPSGLSNQSDEMLRYKRRSSVYSRRTFDGIVNGPAPKPPQPAKTIIVAQQSIPVTIVKKLPPKPTGPTSLDIIPVQTQRPQPVAVPSIPRQQYRQPAAQPKPKDSKPTWKQLLTRSNVLVGMAGFVFLMGVGVSLHSFLTTKNVTQQVQALSSETATDGATSGDEKPDETPLNPKSLSRYTAAPDYPRKITINKIGVEARVKPLGVSKENQLLAPGSIYDAGWYEASAKPGVDAGAVLLDGHVHGPSKPGIFVNLKKLVPGDMIEIERGDGRVVTYRVEKTSQSPVATLDMKALLKSVKPGKQGLNIVTCGGKYDAKTGHYESRDQVFAVQVD